MEFSVHFTTKEGYLACTECAMGYDVVEEVRKLGYNVPMEKIATSCQYSRQHISIVLNEDQVKRALCFKNEYRIDVICETGFFQKYICKKYEAFYDDKTKSFFKKPEIWKVAVEYGLNTQKIIEDWISDGCPCVWGNVENPFGEESNGS